MKTVLVPGAPWPKLDAEVKIHATPERTDEHFEKWVHKQKDALLTGGALGLTKQVKKKCQTNKSSTPSTKTTSRRTSRT